MVVLQFLHQADLCLLLDGLMGGAVLADAEGIVRPDELDGKFHQCRQACCRLDIVAEDEERAAGGNHSAMQGHTVDDGGHGEF